MTRNDVKKRRGRSIRKDDSLPLVSRNYLLFGLGLVVIVIGYFFLSKGPWDSFWSLTLAPILLVVGYCVVIPIAILYRKKERNKEAGKE